MALTGRAKEAKMTKSQKRNILWAAQVAQAATVLPLPMVRILACELAWVLAQVLNSQSSQQAATRLDVLVKSMSSAEGLSQEEYHSQVSALAERWERAQSRGREGTRTFGVYDRVLSTGMRRRGLMADNDDTTRAIAAGIHGTALPYTGRGTLELALATEALGADAVVEVETEESEPVSKPITRKAAKTASAI
jgi:hypothetical protein